MSEQQISTHDLLAIIGDQEVQIRVLKGTVQSLQVQLEQATSEQIPDDRISDPSDTRGYAGRTT